MKTRKEKKRKNGLRYRSLDVVLFLAIIAMFFVSVSVGRYAIPIPDIAQVIIGRTQELSTSVVSILLNSRIPRAAGAILVGMALSVSGASYQSVFGNPMATPDILGAASGSACGAALGILLMNSDAVIQVMAFCFGLAAVMLTLLVSRTVGRGQSTVIYLILVGIVISALFKSGLSIIKYFADADNVLPAITFWLMGGLTNLTNRQLLPVIPIIVIGTWLLNRMRWKMNLLSFGDDEALSMGVNVVRTRRSIILISTLVSSAAISLCGLVGWVGLIIPHCARLLVGANYQRMLPVATLMGGVFMLCVDLLARTMLRVEIPLGILTALMGTPIFIYLLFSGDILNGSE